jgi:hypothetical protein
MKLLKKLEENSIKFNKNFKYFILNKIFEIFTFPKCHPIQDETCEKISNLIHF